ncbi:MAG: glycosyltransferase family 9 protein [Bacteroidetes bacterium]|nr:glycosyltransferase family 9 protein [Bacteroidota bacterium]
MKRILIIQTAFIGDVILATPLIENIKEKFPDCAVDVLVRKGNESLLNAHPKLNQVLIWDKSKSKYAHLFQILAEIRKTKYDTVICVQRFFNAGFLTAFSGAKEKIGFDKNPFSFFFTRKVTHLLKEGIHEVDRNLELIKHWVIEPKRQPALYPSRRDKENVENLQSLPYICIAPASVWFTKQLPEEKWEELINKLTHHQIYLLGAPSDKDLCARISGATKNKNVKMLCGELNLLESTALMAKAEMNFVNDSAPLHLASSVNAPVCAFFCSTVKEFGFYPLSDKSFIAEIEEPLDCRPCGLHGKSACPKGHFKCGKNIDLDQVLRKLHL